MYHFWNQRCSSVGWVLLSHLWDLGFGSQHCTHLAWGWILVLTLWGVEFHSQHCTHLAWGGMNACLDLVRSWVQFPALHTLGMGVNTYSSSTQWKAEAGTSKAQGLLWIHRVKAKTEMCELCFAANQYKIKQPLAFHEYLLWSSYFKVALWSESHGRGEHKTHL